MIQDKRKYLICKPRSNYYLFYVRRHKFYRFHMILSLFLDNDNLDYPN